ncbi:MAG: M81 family metallopeptidase [Chloroflexota bacterium]
MTRVLIGGFMHEVHTFVPGALSLDDVRRNGYIATGEEILGPAIGSGQEIHGARDVALANSVELVTSRMSFGGVGPRIADEAFAYLRDGILEVARREAGTLDGVYLSLHGASATTSEDDPEGALLAAVREIVGPDVPISASFDLHCHMTDRMVASADALIAYRTIPHLDFLETGQRAMQLLVDAMAGRTRPVVRQRKLRMMASAERHDTNHGPMVDIMAHARALETRPGVLAVTVTPTQPWMDVPELGWSITVVADGDPAIAQAAADELAWMLWGRRERFLVHKTPVAQAVEEAIAHPGLPVILADGADSPSAGGNADGNDLLKELLRIGYTGDALLTVVDPAAAAACMAAGIGGTATVPLGGALTPAFYSPVTVTGEVITLRDGRFLHEVPVRPMDIGPSAVLRLAGTDIRILVSTRKGFQLDESIYHQAGLDPRRTKLVLVKSAGGFRGVYEPFASHIIEMDTPGLCTHDLPRLPFHRIPRPMWPWDLDLAEPWPGAGTVPPEGAVRAEEATR